MFLWKYTKKILPTRSFLAIRIQESLPNINCASCGLMVETQEHVFWHCYVAKQVWNDVFDWWGIGRKMHNQTIANIWNWQHLFQKQDQKLGWNIEIASCLWTLGVSRNQLVFNNKRSYLTEIKYLIKWRALKWCEAAGICKKSMSSIWFICPQNFISKTTIALNRLLFSNNRYIYIFVDGAFMRESFNTRKACIGGIFKDIEEKKLGIFMGTQVPLVHSMLS